MNQTREEFFRGRHQSLTAIDTEKGLSLRHSGHFDIEFGSRRAVVVLNCLEDGFSIRQIAAWLSLDLMRSSHFHVRSDSAKFDSVSFTAVRNFVQACNNAGVVEKKERDRQVWKQRSPVCMEYSSQSVQSTTVGGACKSEAKP